MNIALINLTKSGLQIDSRNFSFPIPIDLLKLEFGNPNLNKEKHNTIYTWKELGAYAYSKNGREVECFAIELIKTKNYKFLPANNCKIPIQIEGEHYEKIVLANKNNKSNSFEFKLGDCSVYVDLADDGKVGTLQIQAWPEEGPKKSSDKYKFQKIQGEKLIFNDFNFKLAVVQVLMYEKELLKPTFNIYEFAELFTDRKINIDEEGYSTIPEIKKYFEQLEIDKSLADEVVEIYQDGGNDIYMNMICFWDGEDDVFNIRSVEDIGQFKNLKKATLFYDKDNQLMTELRKQGIETNYL
jgi:hypothetical protein